MDRVHADRAIEADLAPKTPVNKRRRFLSRLGILVGCAVTLFCPYPSTTAPAFRIQITNNGGKPIQRITVREEWMYFDRDIAPWIASGATDDQGYIVFPRRTTWVSLGSRILCCTGPRSNRVGPSAFIVACDTQHLEQATFDWNGNAFWNSRTQSAPIRLTARPVRDCWP